MNFETRTSAVRRSALWAAWGDALGFITELAPNERSVKSRTGHAPIKNTVAWQRRFGGQFGPFLHLPAGSYSDDTQLRLATSRSIRNNGDFDIRAFTKIELPVWLAYALGAGLSSKAAAENLTRSRVYWFNNYYRSGRVNYVSAGGNGGAMRIQPHVWCAPDPLIPQAYVPDVLRNVVSTHGHPRALVGAAFHAMCLAFALGRGRIPGPEDWKVIGTELSMLVRWIGSDSELSENWMPQWERLVGGLSQVDVAIKECQGELSLAADIVKANTKTAYEEMVIGSRANGEERGSAIKTSILASMLAWIHQNDPDAAILEAANVLRTDTDSIASMAGAILGVVAPSDPPGPVQDLDYISTEATRLAAIADGQQVPAFPYPDTINWKVPSALEVVRETPDHYFTIAGLGRAESLNVGWTPTSTPEIVLQWLSLSFGQSMLAKRRLGLKESPVAANAGAESTVRRASTASQSQHSLFPSAQPPYPTSTTTETPAESRERSDFPVAAAWTREEPSVEEAFDAIVSSKFAPSLIGKYLMELSLRLDGHAQAMAFAAMVAKAWRSRRTKASKRLSDQGRESQS